MQDEGFGSYCLCPDVIVTIHTSNIQSKVDLHHRQIKHKYVNEQAIEVSEQVWATNKLYTVANRSIYLYMYILYTVTHTQFLIS